MIGLTGVAGALVGPLPWPLASLPGFKAVAAPSDGWVAALTETALGDAGHVADDLAWRSVGVYRAGPGGGAEACLLAQRWDWCGPALGIDGECAGGLVAVLAAARDLAAGACDLAVVVAEQATMTDEAATADAAPLAARPPPAAHRAGAVVVVLERTATARHCRARLAGGLHRRLGAPAGMVGMSLRGLVDLLQDGLAESGLAPVDLGYAEIHALGTPVGDAVEMTAWARVWAACPGGASASRLGTHKAGFGHLEAPAGLVGLARVLGWYASGRLPPTAWRRPLSTLWRLPSGLALAEAEEPAPLRAGACLALSQSGLGALVLLRPPA